MNWTAMTQPLLGSTWHAAIQSRCQVPVKCNMVIFSLVTYLFAEAKTMDTDISAS